MPDKFIPVHMVGVSNTLSVERTREEDVDLSDTDFHNTVVLRGQLFDNVVIVNSETRKCEVLRGDVQVRLTILPGADGYLEEHFLICKKDVT